ncbi:MAG TPA: NUDIX domain-containing protein [Coleofasciculaceae cyanobacterium]
MPKLKSCGVLVMRTQPQLSFLLMHKPNRYDLPKGRIEFGENELSCALRELYEETGIDSNALQLDETFRFTTTYPTRRKRLEGKSIDKTVVIFLGWLKRDVMIKLSEHDSYSWVEWNPPHAIQKKTIDPLLEQLQQYFQKNGFGA